MKHPLNLKWCRIRLNTWRFWSSGVIGKSKQLDGACLSVAVVFALFIVAGVRQQRSLRVPRYSEGWRLALNLPELLTYSNNTQQTSVREKTQFKLSWSFHNESAHLFLLQQCQWNDPQKLTPAFSHHDWN